MANTKGIGGLLSASGTRCSPGLRLPACHTAIRLGGQSDARRIGRRPSAGDLQLGVTFQHDSYRLTACFPQELCRRHMPAVDCEFAFESTSDVVLIRFRMLAAGIFKGSAN